MIAKDELMFENTRNNIDHRIKLILMLYTSYQSLLADTLTLMCLMVGDRFVNLCATILCYSG